MSEQAKSPGQGVRYLIESLILAAVLWMARTSLDLTTGMAELRTQSTMQTEEIRTLRLQLADVPGLAREISKMQVRQDDQERRLDGIENRPVARWAR